MAVFFRHQNHSLSTQATSNYLSTPFARVKIIS
jgi:hypothetical protein